MTTAATTVPVRSVAQELPLKRSRPWVPSVKLQPLVASAGTAVPPSSTRNCARSVMAGRPEGTGYSQELVAPVMAFMASMSCRVVDAS